MTREEDQRPLKFDRRHHHFPLSPFLSSGLEVVESFALFCNNRSDLSHVEFARILSAVQRYRQLSGFELGGCSIAWRTTPPTCLGAFSRSLTFFSNSQIFFSSWVSRVRASAFAFFVSFFAFFRFSLWLPDHFLILGGRGGQGRASLPPASLFLSSPLPLPLMLFFGSSLFFTSSSPPPSALLPPALSLLFSPLPLPRASPCLRAQGLDVELKG